MSEFYDRMALTAARLLASRGVEGTLTRTQSGTMNAAGDRVDNSPVSAVVGVLMGEEQTLIDGVEANASKAILAPLSVLPEAGDILILAGHKGKVRKANTMRPDGTILYHEVWT